MPLHVGYTPVEPAADVHLSRARYKVIVTGRQASKTTCAAEQFLEQVYADVMARRDEPYNPGAAKEGTASWWEREPKHHYWIVAPTSQHIRTAKARLLAAVPPELLEHTNKSEGSIWLWGHVRIGMRVTAYPETLVADTLDGVWVDEAALAHPDAWHGRIIPALSVRQGWGIFTTTPWGRNWFFDELVAPAQAGEPDYEFFTWTSEDAVRLVDGRERKGLRAEIEAQRRVLSPEFFNREYRASFDQFRGQIFKEYGRKCETHEGQPLEELPRGIQFERVLGGADWGMSNPGALIVGGITRDGHVWFFDEEYGSNDLVEEFWIPRAKKMQAEHRVNQWVGDPEAPDNIRRFNNAGLHMVKHSNYGSGKFDEHKRSVLSGIRLLASLIHQGKLHVTAKCRQLRIDVRMARWARDPAGTWIDSPDKSVPNHALDAARYIASFALKPPTLSAVPRRAA